MHDCNIIIQVNVRDYNLILHVGVRLYQRPETEADRRQATPSKVHLQGIKNILLFWGLLQ